MRREGLLDTILTMCMCCMYVCVRICSDSDDEDSDDPAQDDSFINDGAYTQTSSVSDSGMAMYHSLHRYDALSIDVLSV